MRNVLGFKHAFVNSYVRNFFWFKICLVAHAPQPMLIHSDYTYNAHRCIITMSKGYEVSTAGTFCTIMVWCQHENFPWSHYFCTEWEKVPFNFPTRMRTKIQTWSEEIWGQIYIVNICWFYVSLTVMAFYHQGNPSNCSMLRQCISVLDMWQNRDMHLSHLMIYKYVSYQWVIWMCIWN